MILKSKISILFIALSAIVWLILSLLPNFLLLPPVFHGTVKKMQNV